MVVVGKRGAKAQPAVWALLWMGQAAAGESLCFLTWVATADSTGLDDNTENPQHHSCQPFSVWPQGLPDTSPWQPQGSRKLVPHLLILQVMAAPIL